MSGWQNSFSGVKFFPLDFKPEMVRLKDMAQGLAGKMRYGGQAWLSVAQHSVAVLACVQKLVPDMDKMAGRYVLYHDGSEYVLPDVPRPVKDDPRMEWFREVDAQVQSCIYEAMDVKVDDVSMDVKKALDYVDTMVVNMEKRFLAVVDPEFVDTKPTLQQLRPTLLNVYMTEWTPLVAKRKFLEVAARVTG